MRKKEKATMRMLEQRIKWLEQENKRQRLIDKIYSYEFKSENLRNILFAQQVYLPNTLYTVFSLITVKELYEDIENLPYYKLELLNKEFDFAKKVEEFLKD